MEAGVEFKSVRFFRKVFWMQKFIWMKFAVIPGIIITGQIPAFCQLMQDSSVQETQEGANTEYNVVNSSSGSGLPFNVDAFAVESTGGNPSTTNPGWSAEALDASSWLQSMGGTLSSWLDYTGETYTQAFPKNPVNVNAYVLNKPDMGGAISPDSSLDGFFFQGAPASTDRFMLVNVHGPAIVEGQRITDFGTVEVVPEPATLSLSGIGILLLCRRMKRPNQSPEPETVVLSSANPVLFN
jgi:hypothetical protein